VPTFRETTFEELLVNLASVVDLCGMKNIVNVNRDDMLDGAFRAFARKSFDPSKLLNVRFTGEDGIDNGGLTREFLRLAVTAIGSSSIFTGSGYSKNIQLDYKGMFCLHSLLLFTLFIISCVCQ